ncbi:MAG: hypothetical protein FJ029_09870 [Actinobacteria bacterium]|nr:hypothetical protein [Actinomycetota bacterium]
MHDLVVATLAWMVDPTQRAAPSLEELRRASAADLVHLVKSGDAAPRAL